MPYLESETARHRRTLRRRTLLTGLLPAAALVLTGCGLDHGTVTGKGYEPSYVDYETQCMGFDAKGMCNYWMPMPYTRPECWRLDLRDGDDTGSTCVDRSTWDRIRTGQTFP